jgi:hypothetical protein
MIFPLVLFAQSLLAGTPVAGSRAIDARAVIPAADSLDALRRARRAQSDYELRRRRLLPVTYGGGSCDVQIGRFCYWYDDETPAPPQEPRAIAGLRDTLIARLDESARDIPGDEWIVGQHVRYLVEAGRTDSAIAVAAACRAETSWCSALAGFAYHADTQFAASDSAFAAALGKMEAEERCRWEDIGDLLPSGTARAYNALSCEQQRELAERTWFLADPTWTIPGNDRRTEHYSRHVMSELERRSRSPYDLSWRDDTHRLIVRYGWPTHWSRGAPRTMDISAIHVIGHERHPAFQFFPRDAVLADVSAVTTEEWELRERDAQSRYGPSYASSVRMIDAQLVRLPRGDSLLVLAAFDVAVDSALGSRDAIARTALLDSTGLLLADATVPTRDGRGVSRLVTPRAGGLIGIEIADTVKGGLGLARESVAPLATSASGGRLSDPLLYAQPTSTDATLDDVLDRVMGTDKVAQNSQVGLYWEFERVVAVSDTVTWTVTVVPRDAGLLRRVARALRLRPGASPVNVSFSEPIGETPRRHRLLQLDLRGLPRGTYDLALSATLSSGVVASSGRQLRIVR